MKHKCLGNVLPFALKLVLQRRVWKSESKRAESKRAEQTVEYLSITKMYSY